MRLAKKSDVHLNKRYINNEDNDVNYYGDNENNDNYSNHLEIYDDKDDNGDDHSDNNDKQWMLKLLLYID